MRDELLKKIIDKLRNIYDPEIPISIWDLGLIEDVNIKDGIVNVRLVLTTPTCPLQFILVSEIISKIKEVKGVKDVRVTLSNRVWTPLRMSKEGRRRFKELFGYDIVEAYMKSSSVK